ncbi:permease prefix domain 1-containing protein [Deinococcus sonorensis]|uniref:Permease prefix domain 1-containing protein n=2 Tax=Deinococcus sonorensis TaxID=309891 RepID=A0AAU7U5L1_9DEIO
MTELERYLRRATWGLSQPQRQAIRDELEEHVLERSCHLQAFGVPAGEAERRALAELGPPVRVCAGMNGVYRMPTLIRMTALTTLAVTLGLTSLSRSDAQIPSQLTGHTYLQSPRDALIDELEHSGATVNLSAAALRVQLPDGHALQLPITPYNVRQADGQPVLFLNSLLDQALRDNVPVRISGWDALNITLGGAVVQVKPPSGQQNFAQWYREAALGWVGPLATLPAYTGATATLTSTRPDLAGRVVVAAAIVKGADGTRQSFVAAAPVGPDGKLSLQVPAVTLTVATGAQGRGNPAQVLHTQPGQANALYLGVFSGTYRSGAVKDFAVLTSQLPKQFQPQPGHDTTF